MEGLQNKMFTLNTGAKIPAIGFGTWKAGPGEAAAAVKAAFKAGYRHFVSVFPSRYLTGLMLTCGVDLRTAHLYVRFY
jgi:hypothetical protein